MAALAGAEGPEARSTIFPAFGAGVAGLPLAQFGEATVKALVEYLTQPSPTRKSHLSCGAKDRLNEFLHGLQKVKVEYEP